MEKVLRPFLLRRLKTEVEKGLPPKKEIILKVGLTDMQRQYYKMLLQKDFDAINGTGERSRLLNVVMQVRVCLVCVSLIYMRRKAPQFLRRMFRSLSVIMLSPKNTHESRSVRVTRGRPLPTASSAHCASQCLL